MRFSRVRLRALAYELPLECRSTEWIESRLENAMKTLGLAAGSVQQLTGVEERRFWPRGTTMASVAARAAKKALADVALDPKSIDLLTFAGVCRDGLEPATACHVADAIGVGANALTQDTGNACLGLMSATIDAAMKIEARQIKTALIATAESSREVVEDTIRRLAERPDFPTFNAALATMTGGSGAAAVILQDKELAPDDSPSLQAAAWGSDHAQHRLCHWGFVPTDSPGRYKQVMETDAAAVLKHGIALGRATFRSLIEAWGVDPSARLKVIPHQVGGAHRQAMQRALELDDDQDLATYPLLGNMGTASLPISAALAVERGFIEKGDRVAWLGIGSGLTSLMLGFKWP